MTLHVTNENFSTEVEKSSLPVIIDVYATWCGPCQHMMPLFDELSKELDSRYKFLKLNIDEARDLAIKFNVSSVPTFLFIKAGKIVGKEVGYMNKATLKEKMTTYLG